MGLLLSWRLFYSWSYTPGGTADDVAESSGLGEIAPQRSLDAR